MKFIEKLLSEKENIFDGEISRVLIHFTKGKKNGDLAFFNNFAL